MWVDHLIPYSPLITAVVTVILAGLTAVYVFHTKSMANTMKDEYAVINRGYLGMGDVILDPARSQEYVVTLKNFGHAPLIITKRRIWEKSVIVSNHDEPVILFPSQDSPFILAKKRPQPFMVKVRFEYTTLGKEYFTQYDFELSYSEQTHMTECVTRLVTMS